MSVVLEYFLSDEAIEKGLDLGIPREGDAGFDIKTLENITIEPRSKVLIKTGLHLAIPLGWIGLIRDRSSVAMKGCAVTAGVIDAGYRGEVKILMHNLTDSVVEFSSGDKVAQCLVIPHLPGTASLKVDSLDKLGQTERGAGGFGSTGR